MQKFEFDSDMAVKLLNNSIDSLSKLSAELNSKISKGSTLDIVDGLNLKIEAIEDAIKAILKIYPTENFSSSIEIKSKTANEYTTKLIQIMFEWNSLILVQREGTIASIITSNSNLSTLKFMMISIIDAICPISMDQEQLDMLKNKILNY